MGDTTASVAGAHLMEVPRSIMIDAYSIDNRVIQVVKRANIMALFSRLDDQKA